MTNTEDGAAGTGWFGRKPFAQRSVVCQTLPVNGMDEARKTSPVADNV